jgi:O-antigen/teichoic acid export membrane protein
MKADLIESCDAGEFQRGHALTALAMKVRNLAGRFPSVSNGMLSIFDQAIVSGTTFFTAAIVGRMTSPDELGLYYLVLTIVLVVSGIQDQIVAAPYSVYSKRRQGRELAEFGGSIWLHHGIVSLLTVAGLGVAILVCWAVGNTKIVPGLFALMIVGPLILLRGGIRRFAFANFHVFWAIALDAIVAAIQLGGLFLLGHFGSLSLFGIYAVMGGACGLACVAWYFLDPPRVRFIRQRFAPDWRHNWAFGKWALRSFLVGNTTSWVMLWIVSFAVGAAATGVLGACSTLIGITNVLLLGVDNVLTPHAAHSFATGGAKDLRRLLSITAAFLALALGAFCLIALLTGDWLVVLVFGLRYNGSGPILFTLALSALTNSLGMVVGNGLWAIDQPRANFIADVSCMVVMLVTAAFLIHPWGAFGAALAILAGTTTGCVIRTITFRSALASFETRGELLLNPS